MRAAGYKGIYPVGYNSMGGVVAYISLYRKYRAQDFEELLGQSHVTVTLRNAIQQGRLAHAYLFCGPRGTGKTSTARLLAKSLNCEQGPTPNPCKACRFCRAIQEGNCVDVVEMDAATETSIDDVRTSIIENAKYPPMEARYKIYIIDEVHDLSAKAFDALLKTIEEPPPHVVFILATTEFHRVPPTIRSRCQRFDFHRGTIADITRRLEQVLAAEGFTAEPAALHLVARAADGSWRDALTALEQVIAFSEGGTITAQTVYNALGLLEDETLMQLTDALLERDAGKALHLLEGQMLLGREPRVFAESLIQHWRALIQAALHAHDRAGAYDPTVWSAMMEVRTSSMLVSEAASISMTSTQVPSWIARQNRHTLHGFGVGPCSQLSDLASRRAVEVLPVPRGPQNRYACACRPC